MLYLLPKIQNVLLYFLLLLVGLYAGMHFFHEMCPAESQMSPLEYARYWKIVDGTFMHRRMGIMGPLMIGLFVLNIVVTIKSWKSVPFLLLTVAFTFFIVDVAFTIREQLPINLFINQLDLGHISNNDLSQLEEFQKTALGNFQKRFWFALFSFSTLCLVVFARKRTNQVETRTRQTKASPVAAGNR